MWNILALGWALQTQATVPAQTMPSWAASSFTAIAKARGLSPAAWVSPHQLAGDFDGDGTPDVAVLVEHTRTHKRGIVIVHGGKRRAMLAGAGVEFGNGGDDFAWMDQWRVTRAKGAKADALVVERAESGGGRIVLINGVYRWRQMGD